MATAANTPWWYVAALAGAFTLLGALVSLTAAWLIAHRKNRLDDLRRFDEDIISAYIRLDELADVLHNNAGGDPEEEKDTYWCTYREVLRIATRMELLAPPEIVHIVGHISSVVFDMEPNRSAKVGFKGLMGMPELVEDLDELRKVIRRKLRVGPGAELPLHQRVKLRYIRQWWWRRGKRGYR